MAWAPIVASLAGGALSGILGGGKSQSQPRNVWLDDLQSKFSYNAGQNLYNMGYNTAQMPFTPFSGQRFAPINDLQAQGIGKIASAAQTPSPTLDAANSLATSTMQGAGFRDPGANSYMGQTGGYNPFAGSNPYLQQNIDAALGDVSKAYARGTAAQTDAAAARANALGSSGYNELTQANQGELAKRLGEISSGMRMQDYGMQAQLGESALGRQQQDLSRNATLGESALNRSQTAYDTERANQMRALALAPQTASGTQQYGFNSGNALMGAGGFLQGEQQKPLDFAYQQYSDAREWPYKNLNALASVTPSYQSMAGYGFQPMQQSSTAANVLGGAAMGYGLYNQMTQPKPVAQQPGVTGWTSGYDLPMGNQSYNPFGNFSLSNLFGMGS
jgi:hypothetical protein